MVWYFAIQPAFDFSQHQSLFDEQPGLYGVVRLATKSSEHIAQSLFVFVRQTRKGCAINFVIAKLYLPLFAVGKILFWKRTVGRPSS